jgi:outer membrane protein
MKTSLSVIGAAALLPAMAVALAAQAPPVLTLAQAVSEALAKNDRILNQHDAVEQADLGVHLAENAFRPKVVPNIFGSFGQTDLNSQQYRVDVSQRFLTGTEVRAGAGTSTAQIPGTPGVAGSDVHYYNSDTTITVSQPLLRGFGPRIARRPLTSAELSRADAGRDQTAIEQQVALDTASAYYRLVAQQAFVRVATASLERAGKLRDASEAKLGAGLVSQLDVLRARQLVSQAENQRFDADSSVEDARDTLTFLMDRQRSDPFTVAAEIPRPAEGPIDVDDAIAMALQHRLDLKSLQARAADADRRVSFTRNQLLPQVDVNFALARRETAPTLGSSFGLNRFRFATFFTIAMPIDRTPQQIDYQNALIDRDRQKRETETLQRRVGDDVRRAIREHDRLLRSFMTAETTVGLAQKEVEVAQFRYERGLSNNLDVVNAEADLLNAESRRIQALADLATTGIGLRVALGILDPRRDFAGALTTADLQRRP